MFSTYRFTYCRLSCRLDVRPRVGRRTGFVADARSSLIAASAFRPAGHDVGRDLVGDVAARR
jgi:hypothetical protein